MEFRILGPLEVVEGTTVLRIAPGRERRLLLLLLIHVSRPVAVSSIIDALWPDEPPSSAQKVVQNYVLRLRKALGADAIRTVADGYSIAADPSSVDACVAADRLRRAADALAAGDADAAADLASSALALWRGDALSDVRSELFAKPEIARLDELRLTGIEDAFDASLDSGRHDALVPELRQHVAEHPLRERPRAQLMLALYRTGRQSDALAEYHAARAILREQGLEPARRLRELEAAMLRHDESLEPAVRRRESVAPQREPPSVTAPSPAAPSRRWLRPIGVLLLLLIAASTAAAVAVTDRNAVRSVSALRSNTLAELDPATGEVERSFTVGQTPMAVAVSPDAVWTTSFGDRTVTRVDIRTGRVTIVGSPSTPTAVAASASAAWVVSGFDGSVERLDPSTGALLAVLHLGPGLTDVALGGGRAWVTNELRGSLSSIDPGTNLVSTTTTGFDRPAGVAFGLAKVWVTEEGARRLDAVDPRSGRIVLRIPLFLRPGSMAFGAGSLWIIDPADASLTRVDPVTGRQQVISVGDVPSRVAVAGRRVTVALDRSHELVFIDAASGSVVKRLPLVSSRAAVGGRATTPGGLAASAHAVWLAVQAV